MAGMRGRRKAVVYFSEGLNYNVVDPFNNPHATDVQHEIRELVAAATRANVNVYSVDPRGVTSGMEDAIEIGSVPSDMSMSATAPDGRNAARARQSAGRRRGDRRIRGPEPERLPHGILAHPGGQQPVLRARLPSDQRQARRETPQDPGPRPPAQSQSACPERIRGTGPRPEGDVREGQSGGKNLPGSARRAREPGGRERFDHQRLRRAVQGSRRQRRRRDVDRGPGRRHAVRAAQGRAVRQRPGGHADRRRHDQRQDQGRRPRRRQRRAQSRRAGDALAVPRGPPAADSAGQVSRSASARGNRAERSARSSTISRRPTSPRGRS